MGFAGGGCGAVVCAHKVREASNVLRNVCARMSLHSHLHADVRDMKVCQTDEVPALAACVECSTNGWRGALEVWVACCRLTTV